MSPSAYRRAVACLLALLVTPTAGFASALAATGSASSSASDARPHADVAKRKKKKSKKTAVCSKRSKRARAKAHKSDLTVPVPGVTTVTLPLPPLPGGTTTTPGGTTTTPGGTTTTPGGTTTTPSGGGTTTTGSKPGTTTTGSTKPGSTTTSGGSTKPSVTQGSSSTPAGSSTPSSESRAKSKAKKKARKHKKARRHAKKHRAKKHAKKRVAKKKQPKVVKKHTTKKHGKNVTKKVVKKHATKKKTTKKHATKKKTTKKKTTKKKRKSTPKAPAPAPQQQCTPAPAPTPPPAPTGFTVGLVSGPATAWEANMTNAANLHPKIVRIGYDIGTNPQTIADAVKALADKGSQALPMALFTGRVPSTSEAQNLGNWAKAVGPGAAIWQGRDSSLAPRYIEFGNETNESYQFGGVGSGSSYIARAQSYATSAKAAVDAINANNPNVGLIVQGDNGGCGCSQWVDGMFSAVPDLNKRVAGWTLHPYGPKSRYGPIMDRAVSDLSKHGDTTLPFFLTEYGISTNDGTCLDSNYGWPTCMTYQQASDALKGAIADMRQTWGARVAQIYVFEQRDMANDPGGREANFGAVKSDGSPKGAFTEGIRWLINTYRG
jgi:hypothetical protein